jgi:hypothetical protein
LTATELDVNFWPTPDVARDRFVLVCDLIALEDKVGGGGCKGSCKRKTELLGPISWMFETLSVGKGREEEEY